MLTTLLPGTSHDPCSPPSCSTAFNRSTLHDPSHASRRRRGRRRPDSLPRLRPPSPGRSTRRRARWARGRRRHPCRSRPGRWARSAKISPAGRRPALPARLRPLPSASPTHLAHRGRGLAGLSHPAERQPPAASARPARTASPPGADRLSSSPRQPRPPTETWLRTHYGFTSATAPRRPTAGYGTTDRNRYAARMTRPTMPCSVVARPVPSVTTPAISVSARNTASFGSSRGQRHVKQEGDRGDGRDGQPDAGQRRAERQIQAVLQAVVARRPHRGQPFRQQHERRNDHADRRRRPARCDRGLDRRGERLRKPTTARRHTSSPAPPAPAGARRRAVDSALAGVRQEVARRRTVCSNTNTPYSTSDDTPANASCEADRIGPTLVDV